MRVNGCGAGGACQKKFEARSSPVFEVMAFLLIEIFNLKPAAGIP